MNWIDIVFAALILLIAFFGFIRGMFSVLLHFAAYILSIFGASVIAKAVSPLLYEKFLQARVLTNLRIAVPSGSVSGGVDELLQKVTSSLPVPLARIASFFDLSKLITDNAQANANLTVDEIERLYLNPILTKTLSILAFVVLFILLSLLLRIIAGVIDRAFMKRKGVLPTINKILGGIFGLIKGLIPVAALCALFNVIAPVLNVTSFSELVENSFFCQTVLKILS